MGGRKVSSTTHKSLQEKLESIANEDNFRSETAHMLRQWDDQQEQKRWALYRNWDAEIYRKVEQQVDAFIQDTLDDVKPIQNNKCPVKRDLYKKKEEDDFHRYA